jgi:hypothetical protein
MADARELIHRFLLALLFLFLETLPCAVAQPFDCEPAAARFTPVHVRGSQLAGAIVTIAAGELDQTSKAFNPIPMPENRADVAPVLLKTGELPLGVVPPRLGGGHGRSCLEKSRLRLGASGECRPFLCHPQVEHDRGAEAETRHVRAPLAR